MHARAFAADSRVLARRSADPRLLRTRRGLVALLATVGLCLACADAPAGVTTAPTPVAPPERGAAVYIVQRGDFLAKIAAELGVPLAALIELNALVDPNSIEVGQQLRLPPGTLGGAQPAREHDAITSLGSDAGSAQRRLRVAGLEVALPAAFDGAAARGRALTASQTALLLVSALVVLGAALYVVAALVRLLARSVALLTGMLLRPPRAMAAARAHAYAPASATVALPVAAAHVAAATGASVGTGQRAAVAHAPSAFVRVRGGARGAARRCAALVRAAAHASVGVGRSGAVWTARRLRRYVVRAVAATRATPARQKLVAQLSRVRATVRACAAWRLERRRAAFRRELAMRQDGTLLRIGLADEAELWLRRLLIECQREGWEPEAGLCLLGLADVEIARSNAEEARALRTHAAVLLGRARPKDVRELRAVRHDWGV